MKIRLAAPLQADSIVDGEGIRTVIWTQGCSHKCKGCHNPATHDFNGGYEVDVLDIVNEIKDLKCQDGLTFSGGDPMFQIDACTVIAKEAKKLNLDIWCYTGFTYEQLMNNEKALEFLKYIDVLVDGKFVEELKSLNVDFRGSKNQRIIDVKKSLENKRVVLIPKYQGERTVNTKVVKEEHIYI